MTLAKYLEQLDAMGQLLRVTVPVDTDLEVAELTDRQSKSVGGGDALLFTDTGTDFPVATNIFGSNDRICKALRVNDLSELEARIDALLGSAMSPKRTIMEKLAMLPLLKEVAGFMPRHKGGRGDCQTVTMNTDLSLLPILKCAPHDAAPFFTLPLVHTIDPETGVQNVGMYRMQVIDNQTTGMHWHRHKTGESHYLKYKARGERMPVTVCLGGDPAYTYCATAPLPEGIDEYILAGFLRQKAVNLVKCLDSNIEIPSDVDFVLEGYVDPAEEKFYEGPFGDHTGFYSLEDYYPKFHITRITHRRNAIFPATLVGIPPMEDFYYAAATERIFMSPIRFVIAPELKNLYMPACGVAHNIASVTISKTYPGQAQKVASALWGAGQMSFNKFCLVFSQTSITFEDNKFQLIKQLQDALPFFNPQLDVQISRGTLDVLDHAAPAVGYGGKMVVDLTEKLMEEGERISAPIPNEQGAGRVLVCYYTTVLNDPHTVDVAKKNGSKIILLFDRNVPIDTDIETLLWLAAANCDPSRDITITPENVMIIDARAKISDLVRHPNVVCMSRKMIEQVDSRWEEYNVGKFIASPSLKYTHLQFSDSAQVTK